MRQIKNSEKEQISDSRVFFIKETEEKKENDIFFFPKEEVKNKEEKTPIKVSQKFKQLSNDMYQKFHLINKDSQKLKKLNTFSLQKISKEYFRITPRKILTLKTIKKIISDNNIPLSPHSTLNTNSSHSSINYANKKKFRTISAYKKLSNSTFHNYNKIRSKNNKIKRFIDKYESNKEIIDENCESQNDTNLRILASLTKNKTSEKLKNYINININDLYKHNNKNIINLDRFNNSFRIQMNNTCYKFIPYNHIRQLNELQRDNRLVRESMENIKNKLDLEIQDFKAKKLLVKKYNKIKQKLRSEKNKRIFSARKLQNYPDKIPYNIKFQNERNIFPYGFKVRALYEHHVHSLESERHKQRLIKIEKKNEPQKNLRINDSLMDKALKKLCNSLDVKNIHKYINYVKKEKIETKREDTERKENKYFPMLKEANNIIQKFDINKINKKYKIKEKSKGFMEIDEDDVELEENIADVEAELRKLKY